MQGENGERSQVQTALLAMRAGCTTRTTLKWLVYEGPGVSWVVGTCCRGAQVGLGVYLVDLELWSKVQSEAEQGVEPLLADTSLMTWQVRWTREALW
jgi:hypothetical protein